MLYWNKHVINTKNKQATRSDWLTTSAKSPKTRETIISLQTVMLSIWKKVMFCQQYNIIMLNTPKCAIKLLAFKVQRTVLGYSTSSFFDICRLFFFYNCTLLSPLPTFSACVLLPLVIHLIMHRCISGISLYRFKLQGFMLGIYQCNID